MDLIEFLRARLDEDERVARAAGDVCGGHWTVRDEARMVVGFPMDPAYEIPDGTAPHIARWDPARVLAEVEAKRRILEQAEGIHTFGDMWAWSSIEEVLTALAQPYADHPDFDPAWLLTPA